MRAPLIESRSTVEHAPGRRKPAELDSKNARVEEALHQSEFHLNIARALNYARTRRCDLHDTELL